MSLNFEKIEALYKLYPNVVRTVGDEAFDADGNQVQYDLQAVTTQAEKDQQAVEQAKQSAIAKLTAIGLTADEIAALGVK